MFILKLARLLGLEFNERLYYIFDLVIWYNIIIYIFCISKQNKIIFRHQKKKMKNYVIKQEGLNENNISEHIISYHSSRTQKSKDEANDV